MSKRHPNKQGRKRQSRELVAKLDDERKSANAIDTHGEPAPDCTCAGKPLGPVAGHLESCPTAKAILSATVGGRRLLVRP